MPILQILFHVWTVLITVLSAVGLLFTIFDFFQIRSEIKEWWKRHKEFARSAKDLALTEYFIVHVIQLGGQFSMVHTLTVRVDSDGGWYLNPPNRFAWSDGIAVEI